jgi:hypothetical protein
MVYVSLLTLYPHADDNDHTADCTDCIIEAALLIRESLPLIVLGGNSTAGSTGDTRRKSGKVERAFERMRRASTKAIESRTLTSLTKKDKEELMALLISIADALRRELTNVSLSCKDISTRMIPDPCIFFRDPTWMD